MGARVLSFSNTSGQMLHVQRQCSLDRGRGGKSS